MHSVMYQESRSESTSLGWKMIRKEGNGAIAWKFTAVFELKHMAEAEPPETVQQFQ